MPIPEPPPDPTHFRVLLTDPEGFDKVEIKRMLEDCDVEVLQVEELSQREMELQTKKPSEQGGRGVQVRSVGSPDSRCSPPTFF